MSQVVIVPDAAAAGSLIADTIAARVAEQPALVLGVATGSSPLPVYRALAERAVAGLDFSAVRACALDEYVGLPEGHPESYRAVLEREVVQPLGMDGANLFVPDGSAEGAATAGERYEAQLAELGGVDVQLLGIGTNGHIGFNEHGSSLSSLSRLKTLTEQTRRDNARFFDSLEQVPVHCITQGLGTILRAGHLVLLATGEAKAAAVAAAVEGPVSSACPASVIQLHRHVSVVLDDAAASRLRFADYYRHAWQNRLPWQEL